MKYENMPPVQEREKSSEQQHEKPQKLYRGMRERNKEFFDPQENVAKRDLHEDALVFATPDKACATMFLVPEASDSWTLKGCYDGVWVHVISDEKLYRELDSGGSVYEITDVDDFYCDREKGMKESEWTSQKRVAPSTSEEYDNSVDAMMDNGVQVYFVDENTFLAIATADDKGAHILSTLQSENQKTGKNVIHIPDATEESEKPHDTDSTEMQKWRDDFLSQYYTRNFQKYISTVTKQERDMFTDALRTEHDTIEKVMRGDEHAIDVCAPQLQEALRMLYNDMLLYKKHDPHGHDRFVRAQMRKFKLQEKSL